MKTNTPDQKILGGTRKPFAGRPGSVSFVRVIARSARIYATLPSGFSGLCPPHNVVRHQSRPEQRLETPFSPVCEHQRPFYLAENDAAPEAASRPSRESRGQHMRQN